MKRQPQARKGFVKFMRLGPIKHGEQSRWDRAPEKRGMWAFPYPYFDMFFAYHKYQDSLPKALKTDRETGYPLDRSWIINVETNEPISNFSEYLDEDNYLLPEFEVSQEFHEKRNAWIENVGKKIVTMKTFWYRGPLYSHFLPNGQIGDTGLFFSDNTDWTLLDSTRYFNFLRKSNWDYSFEHRCRTSIDHMEVFLPAHTGELRTNL